MARAVVPAAGEPADGGGQLADGAEGAAADGLAAYKSPRLIEFRDSLPMTATGKILECELA